MTTKTQIDSTVCRDCGHTAGYSPTAQCACSYDSCPTCLSEEAAKQVDLCKAGDHDVFFDMCVGCGLSKWDIIDAEQEAARKADEAECLSDGGHVWSGTTEIGPYNLDFCLTCGAEK